MDAFHKLIFHTDELEKQNRDLTLRINEIEQEIRVHEAKSAGAERANTEREKALEKLQAAEDARAAAERVAAKERSARLAAEEEADNLKARIVQLQEKPSRLKQLRDEIGV